MELIPPHGGYRKLVTYRLGCLIYDATAAFCKKYISPKDRTFDQMVQAARSGVANIVEASEAGATSRKTELKLTNVAKASQEELLFDYQAFLRQRNLPEWESDSPDVRLVRNARCKNLQSLRQAMSGIVAQRKSFPDAGNSGDLLAEVAANVMIVLINQQTYLISRQLKRLSDDFMQNGGFTERLYRTRTQYRDKK